MLLGGEETFSNVPVRINGTEGADYLVTINTNKALLTCVLTVHVTLRNCSLGFVYDQTTKACNCEIDKFLDGVTCNTNGSISYNDNDWIGVNELSLYIRAPCIRKFCEIGVSVVNLSEPDTQCRNHRSGLLCGGCADGYSRILGGTQCEVCTNNHYLALIVLFAAFGILLFVVLALFNVTITDGFVNGFIFYVNNFLVCTSQIFSLSRRQVVHQLLL